MQLVLKSKRRGVRKVQRMEFDSSDPRRMEFRFGKEFVEWVNRNFYDILIFQTMTVCIGDVRFTIVGVGDKYFDVGKKYAFSRRFANRFNGDVTVLLQLYDEGWIYQIEWKARKYWVGQEGLLRLLTEDISIDTITLPDPVAVLSYEGQMENLDLIVYGDYCI